MNTTIKHETQSFYKMKYALSSPYKGECTFENNNWNDGSNGMCGWTQSNTDDFDWRIGSANTPSVYTGPRADHTLNTSAGI